MTDRTTDCGSVDVSQDEFHADPRGWMRLARERGVDLRVMRDGVCAAIIGRPMPDSELGPADPDRVAQALREMRGALSDLEHKFSPRARINAAIEALGHARDTESGPVGDDDGSSAWQVVDRLGGLHSTHATHESAAKTASTRNAAPGLRKPYVARRTPDNGVERSLGRVADREAQGHGGPFANLDADLRDRGRWMLVSVDGVLAGDGRDDDVLVEVHAGDLVTVARALARSQNGVALISRMEGDTMTVIGEEMPPEDTESGSNAQQVADLRAELERVKAERDDRYNAVNERNYALELLRTERARADAAEAERDAMLRTMECRSVSDVGPVLKWLEGQAEESIEGESAFSGGRYAAFTEATTYVRELMQRTTEQESVAQTHYEVRDGGIEGLRYESKAVAVDVASNLNKRYPGREAPYEVFEVLARRIPAMEEKSVGQGGDRG